MKKGPLYAEWYIQREREKGKRFTPEQVKALHAQYQGIYLHPDGKRFIAVANVPVVGMDGKVKYRRPEKTFSTVTAAKAWLEDQRSHARKRGRHGVTQNPTLLEIMQLTEGIKKTKVSWRSIKRYRTIILEYFGEDRRLLSITTDDYLQYQAWLLSQPRRTYHASRGFIELSGTLAPATVDKACKELAWLFREARKRNMIQHEVDFPLLGDPGSRPFNIDLESFLACLEYLPQHKAMLMLALNTGGRLSDVFHLTEDRVVTRMVAGGPGDQGHGSRLRNMPGSSASAMFSDSGDGRKRTEDTSMTSAALVSPEIAFQRKTFITIRSSKGKRDNIEVPLIGAFQEELARHQERQEALLETFFNALTDEPSTESLSKTSPARRKRLRARYERARVENARRLKEAKTKPQRRFSYPIPVLKPVEELSHPRDLNPCGYVFLNPENLHPYSDIQTSIDTAVKKAGVARFTMHTIRHLATTVLLDITGGDLDLVKNIVGWSDRAMVQIYGHLGVRHMKAFDTFDRLVREASETTNRASPPAVTLSEIPKPKPSRPSDTPQPEESRSNISQAEPHKADLPRSSDTPQPTPRTPGLSDMWEALGGLPN